MELNILIQKFELSWVLALNQSLHINAELFNSLKSLKKLENRLHKDEKTDRQEDKQWDTKLKKKNLRKPTLSVVNAGSPDTEYLYYPLNVEVVPQKGSLLPAYIR